MTESTKPMIVIKDVSTGEIIQREMNEEEYAQLLADKAAYEAQVAAEETAAQAKASAKKAALAALGLSQEIVNLLAE
jgi:hypothetical protein